MQLRLICDEGIYICTVIIYGRTEQYNIILTEHESMASENLSLYIHVHYKARMFC